MEWVGFGLLTILNLIALFISGKDLKETVKIGMYGDPDCSQAFPSLDLGLGICIFLVFLLLSIAFLLEVRWLQINCAILLCISIMLILGISHMIDGDDKVDDKKDISQYYVLESYPQWAQNLLVNERQWATFRGCLIQKDVCRNNKRFKKGCCNPPTYCGFQYKNLTWVIPELGRYSRDQNYIAWSSDPKELCYNCNTCKASYMGRFAYDWIRTGGNLIFTSFLIVPSVIVAFSNDK